MERNYNNKQYKIVVSVSLLKALTIEDNRAVVIFYAEYLAKMLSMVRLQNRRPLQVGNYNYTSNNYSYKLHVTG